MRRPDFDNLLQVLKGEVPDRPTMFELLLNKDLYEKLSGMVFGERGDELDTYRVLIHGFKNAGYDYALMGGSDFEFQKPQVHDKKTYSLNEEPVIIDRKSFENFDWQDPEKSNYSKLEKLKKVLPDGMRLVIAGPAGMLENVVRLMGYDNLCYVLKDDPDLVKEIFDSVCSRLVRYYEICLQYDTVGAIISNDDWGFKTQTMLSIEDLRKYLFPWQKKLVDVAHAVNKPALLHSCGNLNDVMDDVIDFMQFDGKHSYEDNIIPVEDAYELWGSRIAILGGIDVNYLCTKTTKEIYDRSKAMLERTKSRGRYALGSGNSIPEYVQDESFFAMTSAALE